MSNGFAAVPNWLVEEPSVSAHEKLVYLVLSSKIGDQGAWFISHTKIGEMAGISTRSVQRALEALRDRGAVTWEPRFDEATNAQLGNSYRLMTDRLGQSDRPPRPQGPTPPVSVADQNNNPEKEPRNTPPTPSDDEQFDTLVWQHWPNKNGKAAARKKWRTAVAAYRKSPEYVASLAGQGESLADVVRKFGAAYRATTPPKFIPMLATWLNGERWSDPLPTDRGKYEPDARMQKPINEGPFDSQGALKVPAGMRAVYDDVTGRFDHFEPRDRPGDSQ